MILTAQCYYAIAGLWVEKDVLGRELHFERGSIEVTVTLPPDADAFEEELRAAGAQTYGIQSALGDLPEVAPWLSHLAEVTLFKITLRGKLDASIDDLRGRYPIWGRTEAGEIAVEVTDWARAWRRQSWLGLVSQEPLFIAATFRDDSGAYSTSVRGGSTGRAVSTDTSVAVGQQHLAELAHNLANRVRVPLPELFLADARYLMEQSLPNSGRVVLAAAIATEIKTKDTMRQAAEPEQLPLVELILENPRDVSLAAANLLDKGMEAVTGRSLRNDNRTLYKRADELFQLRNDVAHRGVTPGTDVARENLHTAEAVCSWLDTVGRSREGER